MKTKIFKWLAIFLVGLTGCYDYSNFENFAFEPFSPSYMFPLIKDSVTIKEIFEQSDSISLIRENTDNSYSLLFRDTVDAGSGNDQITIPNQNFNQRFIIPGIPPVIVPDLTLPFDELYDDNITTAIDGGGTIELKQVEFTSGSLRINIVNNFRHIVTGKIIITSLKSKIAPYDSLVLPFTLNGIGTTFNPTINLVDYNLDSYNNSKNLWNNINYRVIGSLTTVNNPISAGDNVSVQVSILNPVFKSFKGKINYSYVQPVQSYNVNLYEASSNISQHFEDPKLTLQFINSFGVPASANFTEFDFVNASGTTSLTTTGTSSDDLKIGTPNIIAHITGTQQTATTTLKLNRTNSNIVAAFNSSPETISLGARFDFGDNTNNHDYFVNSTSTIKLISEIEIPLYGWFKVSLSDTTKLDLTPTDSMDFNVDDANIIFTFLIRNQIPINIYLQVTFLNDANQTLALLFDGTPEEMLVKSADVDANGISTNTAVKKTDIRITKTKYNLMAKATKMVISYRLNTGGTLDQAVKILSTNRIGIQASISINGIIKPEL